MVVSAQKINIRKDIRELINEEESTKCSINILAVLSKIYSEFINEMRKKTNESTNLLITFTTVKLFEIN